MNMMIIDDHSGIRSLIRQLIAAPGDEVCECASGNEAVEAARTFRPDWVTVDVRMPGLDGFAAARALRAEHPTVRLAIVTAFDQPEFRRSAVDVGAVGYIMKDNLAELRSVLAGGTGAAGQRNITTTASGRVAGREEG